jgi:hypothetical protein
VAELHPERLDVDRLLYLRHRHHPLPNRLTHLTDDGLEQLRLQVQEILVAPRRAVTGNDDVGIEQCQRPQAPSMLTKGGVK